MKNNKGYTLVEMSVGMTIFVILIVMIVGFFIALFRLQTEYRMTANLQQESRTISETFSRQAREATVVQTIPEFPGGNATVKVDICNADPAAQNIDTVAGSPTFGQHTSVTLTMLGGSTVTFDCQMIGGANRFQFGTLGPLNGTDLTTDRVNVKKFTLIRDRDIAFPKTLRYNIVLVKSDKPWNSSVPGDFISIEGYLNMRNEQ